MLPTIYKNFKLIASKLRPKQSEIRKIASKLRPKMILNAEEFFRILDHFRPFNFDAIFRIFDRLGLNFDAINLKFSQIVGNIAFYNL